METQVKKTVRLINRILKIANLTYQEREDFIQLKKELKPLQIEYDRGKFHSVLKKLITWGIVCDRIIKELISLWISDKQ